MGILSALLALGLGVSAVSCGKTADSSSNTVKIAYLPITHSLAVLEEAEELEKQSGLKVELVKYGSWNELLDALNSNRVDGASVLIELAMKSRQEGIGTIEPLGDLFKDEVRQVGEKLGIPHDLVWRQPFPGPGLGVRIIGEITEEKIKILQEADAVFRDEIRKSGIEEQLKQFFAVLPDVRTVGVMGDHRTYDHLITLSS